MTILFDISIWLALAIAVVTIPTIILCPENIKIWEFVSVFDYVVGAGCILALNIAFVFG